MNAVARAAVAERDLAWAVARVLDEATVQLLTLTSSPGARMQAEYEERTGVKAYDDAPRAYPRDELLVCAVCGGRFWRATSLPGSRPTYCSGSCRSRAYVRRKHAAATAA